MQTHSDHSASGLGSLAAQIAAPALVASRPWSTDVAPRFDITRPAVSGTSAPGEHANDGAAGS